MKNSRLLIHLCLITFISLCLCGCLHERPTEAQSTVVSTTETKHDAAVEFSAPTAEHVELPAVMQLPGKDVIGETKIFRGEGFTISLSDRFIEKDSEMGFDAYYTSPYCGVMVLKEPFSLKEGMEKESLPEYIANVLENNKNDARIQETDGLYYYRYTRDGMAGVSYSFKGSDAFYIFQFLCMEKDEKDLRDLFFFFAKSVEVE